jgi:hypothetical protein
MAGKKDDRIENVVAENETGFYTFNQNNSGGRFDRDSDVDHYVVIEGRSIKEVISRATDIGIYFDGHGDCPCCGNRWSEPYDGEELNKVPSLYGTPLVGPFTNKRNKTDTVVVHYLDGTRAYGTSKYVGQTDTWSDLALGDRVRP